jgi:hypothetical protein
MRAGAPHSQRATTACAPALYPRPPTHHTHPLSAKIHARTQKDKAHVFFYRSLALSLLSCMCLEYMQWQRQVSVSASTTHSVRACVRACVRVRTVSRGAAVAILDRRVGPAAHMGPHEQRAHLVIGCSPRQVQPLRRTRPWHTLRQPMPTVHKHVPAQPTTIKACSLGCT